MDLITGSATHLVTDPLPIDLKGPAGGLVVRAVNVLYAVHRLGLGFASLGWDLFPSKLILGLFLASMPLCLWSPWLLGFHHLLKRCPEFNEL
jgi:hypothetical protein